MKVALARCAVLPEPDIDEAPLIDALTSAGHDTRCLPWDDPEADVAAFDVVVLRATWNYTDAPDAFESWLAHVTAVTQLENPLALARWNLRKTYLRELAGRGVPVVPTAWLTAATDPTTAARIQGWADVVAKPVVGAGSRLTRRFATGDPALAAFVRVSGRPMMLQPYVRSVETTGERSVVVIDGVPTHAVRKHPRFAEDHERVEAVTLEPALANFARSVVQQLPEPPLHARVDVLEDDEGALVVGEVELVEPSLFFTLGPEALGRFVRGLERRVAGRLQSS